MVGRGKHHVACAFLVGENHRLEHVHHLSDIGHLYAVGVFVEHVEAQRGYEGIAECVLLIQVTGDGAGLLVPPGAPLINEQTDGVLRVFLVHDGLVLLDDLLNLQTLAQSPVILVVVELRSGALRTFPSRASIIM